MSSQPAGNILLREMTAGDLPEADHLRRTAGWNQTAADWQRLLRLDPGGCFVAAREDRVIGSVTTTRHGPSLAWIGMMLVHPDDRGRGTGARLMEAALRHLERSGVRTVKLDATPLGLPLYEKFGFIAEETLERCHRAATEPAGDEAFPEEKTRRLTTTDWTMVEMIDAEAFGAPRSALLRSMAEGARASLVWPAEGLVAGYGLLRPGDQADYLGPGVCSSPEGVAALTASLLRRAGARPVFWDVRGQNVAAKELARQFGFLPARPLTRMRRGPEVSPGDPTAQFAIADPAVG